MIIKSYIENTAAAALKKIREEMGQQALILHTRHIGGGRYGRRIEVTACIDETLVPSLRTLIGPGVPGDILSRDAGMRRNTSPSIPTESAEKPAMPTPVEMSSELAQIYERMMDFDLPPGPADMLIQDIQSSGDVKTSSDGTIRSNLVSSIGKLINREVHIPTGSKVMFIGASGAGKTSTLAKMAAELVAFRRVKVRLTSYDTQKISAYEEVGGYADLLDTPYDINPRSEPTVAKNEVLLIDTPSMTYSPGGIAAVQNLINLAKPNLVFMVLSVCNRAGDLIDFQEGIRTLQPDLLIATHLDETRRWGSMLAAAMTTGVPLAFVTDSPGGMGQLHVPDSEVVVAKMLNEKEAPRE